MITILQVLPALILSFILGIYVNHVSHTAAPALTNTAGMVQPGFVTPPFNANQTHSNQAFVRTSPVGVAPSTRTVVIERPVTQVYIKDRDERTYWQRHPKVKAATVGAGVGTAAGAVTGLITGRGVLRGAVIGAGTGAGVGLVRASNTLKRHPIVQDTATGSLVGLGVAGAGSRREGRMAQGAGVGAAVGLGWGLLKHGLN